MILNISYEGEQLAVGHFQLGSFLIQLLLNE